MLPLGFLIRPIPAQRSVSGLILVRHLLECLFLGGISGCFHDVNLLALRLLLFHTLIALKFLGVSCEHGAEEPFGGDLLTGILLVCDSGFAKILGLTNEDFT